MRNIKQNDMHKRYSTGVFCTIIEYRIWFYNLTHLTYIRNNIVIIKIKFYLCKKNKKVKNK